jgi:plastocyanin
MRRKPLAALVLAPLLLLIAAVGGPALVQAGGGCHPGADGSQYMEGDGTAVIRMDTCSFAPTASRVAVGTTVRFLNTATIPHQVVGRSATWGSVLLEPGREHSETFAAAGVYPYACPLHPGMVGAIVVGDGTTQAADLAAATQPTDPAATQPDPNPFALAGLLGLAIGIAVGVAVARVRPRTIS